jgi:hypothetical protein
LNIAYQVKYRKIIKEPAVSRLKRNTTVTILPVRHQLEADYQSLQGYLRTLSGAC